MKHHRFIGDFDFKNAELTVSDPELLHQWKRVLRLKEGDELLLVNEQKQEALVRIEQLLQTDIVCRVLEVSKINREPSVAVHLYCSVLKRENFELVVQKATEVGVTEFIPVISKRTVKLGVRTDRMFRIAKEAAEQCGRAMVPNVVEPLSFDEAVEHAKQLDSVFFFDIGGMADTFNKQMGSVGIFIGPEGGWDEEERNKAEAAGFTVAGLGELTLRAETAAIVASYMVIRSGLEN